MRDDGPPDVAHDCAAALVVQDDRALLCRRSAGRPWNGGLWGLPGGHLRADEAAHEALLRELREELGIDALLDDILPSMTLHEPGELRLQVWRVDKWAGTLANRAPEEHDLLRWVTRAEALRMPTAQSSLFTLCDDGWELPDRGWAGTTDGRLGPSRAAR